MSYVFFFTFFHSLSFSPWIWLVAASISHFVTAATKFWCCSSIKKSPLSFLSLALYLYRLFLIELRWPATYFLFFSVFLLRYIRNFVDMTINLSLILSTTRIQKQFPLSVFVYIDSLIVSALQDAGGYTVFLRNNLELIFGCYTCWSSYFTLICLWCWRTDGRAGGWAYGHVITKFPRMGKLLHFLTHDVPLRSLRARELRYNCKT